MRISASSIALLVFTALTFSGVQAQATAASDNPIVISQLSLQEVRTHIEQIEKAFYDRFNALTDKDELKIECLKIIPTGTSIAYRGCRPAFVSAANQDFWRTSRYEFSSLRAGAERQQELAASYQLLEAELDRLVAEDSLLYELNDVLSALRARLAQLET